MRNTYQSHMHVAYKETIFLHAACVFLSFVKFYDLCELLFILYRESRTHHLHILKLPHRKNSIFHTIHSFISPFMFHIP